MNDRNYKYLDKIDLPKDLRKFEKNDLENICNDLREFIINSISENGGHFGASLGVVELTVALHYVYNTPKDSIVWDVGHQAYGHKILTGRKETYAKDKGTGTPNILIDDRPVNIQRWQGAGGYGILYQANRDSLEKVKKGLEGYAKVLGDH